MRARWKLLSAMLAVFGVGGCAKPDPVQFFPPDAYPERLSEWGILQQVDNRLQIAGGVEPYDLNTPLFTDYAQKLRTVWIPPGASAIYQSDESFEFPTGTILSKTFFYPLADSPDVVRTTFDWPRDRSGLDTTNLKVLETRLLVRQEHGWDALPYVWRGNDAYLKIAGALEMMTIQIAGGAQLAGGAELADGETVAFPYVVPTRNECASCHATNHSSGDLLPIGLKARHLNRGYQGANGNQLLEWQSTGRLRGLPELDDIPANADALDPEASVAARARAYLDTNCAHCHNAVGAADTSGLILDANTSAMRQLGVCKPPIAAGGGSGGRAYSIVPGEPDASILIYRLQISDPGNQMPEIGRTLVHTEGLALLRNWISSLDGACIENTPG
jgi:uncharacterized repeat protein (TIGR03806 family)